MLQKLSFIILLFLTTGTSFSQNWTKLADYPGLGRDDACAFSIGSDGYIVTGNHAGFWESNHHWKYNTKTKEWSRMADFIGERRQYALSFSYKNYAYIVGGISENNVPLNDMYRYNSLNDSWQKMDSFPGLPRWSASGATLGNATYVFGGTTLNNTLNDAWQYNFESEKWSSLPPTPSNGKRDQVCFTSGNKIYLSLGFSIVPFEYSKETFSYDPMLQTWTQEMDFPDEALSYATSSSTLQRAFVLGGYTENGSYRNSVWQFENNSWLEIPSPYSQGIRGTSTFTIDNKCYFLTGKNENLTLSKELFELSYDVNDDFYVYSKLLNSEMYFNAPLNTELKIFDVLGNKISDLKFTFSNEISYKIELQGLYFAKFKLEENGEIKSKTIKFIVL